MKRLLVLVAVVMSAIVGVTVWRRRQSPAPTPVSSGGPALAAVRDRLSVPEVTPPPAPEPAPNQAEATAPTKPPPKKSAAKKSTAKKPTAKKPTAKKAPSAAKPSRATATTAAAPKPPRRPRTQEPDSAS